MLVPVPDGSVVDVTVTPVADPSAPTFIIWPAFGARARFYRQLSRALAERGYASAIVEWPGRGDSTPHVTRRSRFGYHALAAEYAPAVTGAIRALSPESPIYILGHSLGGHVGALYAATHVSEISGLVLAASASPYFKPYGAVGLVRSYAGTTSMTTVARIVGYWPGDTLKFWGRQSRVLVADWSRTARTGRFAPAGADVDYEKALAAADLDVFAFSIEDDPLAPTAAVDEMVSKLKSARVERWHSAQPVGHIQWVRNHDEILNHLDTWMSARSTDPIG